MANVFLAGDSIFDNKAYVGSEPDVTEHLTSLAPESWSVSLVAVDGAVVQGVPSQLSDIPQNATHLVISAGGNNALMNADILQMPASSSAEVFRELSRRAAGFENLYGEMLDIALSRGLSTAVCTIYFPNFGESTLQRVGVTALSVFNDVIIRLAAKRSLPILNLRLVCSDADDYANEIEPSGKGGWKIADAIVRLLGQHDFARRVTQIYF